MRIKARASNYHFRAKERDMMCMLSIIALVLSSYFLVKEGFSETEWSSDTL